jgi:hypothetical protein
VSTNRSPNKNPHHPLPNPPNRRETPKVDAKPPCREVINLLFVDLDTEFVYRYNIKGTSLAPVKDFRETIRKSVQYAKAKGITVPYYGLVTTMGALKIKNNKGTFFNPKFNVVGNLLDDPDKLARIGEMATYFNTKRNYSEVDEDLGSDPVDTVMDGTYESAAQYEAA